MRSEHRKIERMIETEFTGGLPPEEGRRLADHLRGCDACAKVYERWSQAERAMTPSAPVLTRGQADRVASRLFAGTLPKPRRGFLSVGVFAATAAAAVLLVVVPSTQELQPRGGVEVVDPRVSLRALRIRRVGGDLQAAGADQGLAPGDHLRLLYTAPAGVDGARVTLTDGANRVHLLFEGRIEPAIDGKLGAPMKVDHAWAPGEIRITASFSRGEEELRRTVETRLAREAP